ncbi:MAG TPA: class I SAM-dependent methyltransferase [Terriglobales bacterium]|nr:class I SAM-dependent methyltransferase [Terriglobales bacterium]
MKDQPLTPPAANQPETLDSSPVIDLIEAFRRSKAMFAAVSLGVFDTLEDAPASVETLAAVLQLQREPLERLLNACVGLKLLRKNGVSYANEPIASTYLCRGSDRALIGYILYSNDVLFPLWSHLEDAVREGTSRWEQEFGGKDGIFANFFRTPDAKATFLRGMHGFGLLSSPKVVNAFDLSEFRRMADVGGGTGHLAMAACSRYPNLRAVVLDLPDVVEITKGYLDKSGLPAERVSVTAGDFFRDPLPEADLVAVGRILHDWSDAKVGQLLAKVFKTLPSGGAVLIAEKLLNEQKTGPTPALLQSLNMLVCTEGRERTLSEYRQLLEAAGFEQVQGRVTGAYLDAVIARKP